MSIDPRHLVQLSAIVETGSFAEAALRLDLAQSALSRNIKTLEARVGAPVLRRGRLGAKPTEIGAALAQYGNVIRSAHVQASTIVSSISLHKSDHLRLAATHFIAENFLVGPLSDFMRRRANLRCVLQTGSVGELVAMVSTGEADLAIGQFGTLVNSEDLRVEPLIDDYMSVVARAGHPLARRNTASVEALGAAEWIVPTPELRLRWQIEKALRDLGIVAIDVRYETTSMAAMMAIMSQSDCVALVPRLAVTPMIEEGRIKELLPSARIAPRTIGLLCPAAKRSSALINSFCRDLHKAAQRAMGS